MLPSTSLIHASYYSGRCVFASPVFFYFQFTIILFYIFVLEVCVFFLIILFVLTTGYSSFASQMQGFVSDNAFAAAFGSSSPAAAANSKLTP